MKRILLPISIVLLSVMATAKDKSIKMSCDDAIKQAGVLATNHKWTISDAAEWKGDASGESKIVSLITKSNVGTGKQVGLAAATLGYGQFFMIPKQGTLVFKPTSAGCQLMSDGKPANKIREELQKMDKD